MAKLDKLGSGCQVRYVGRKTAVVVTKLIANNLFYIICLQTCDVYIVKNLLLIL